MGQVIVIGAGAMGLAAAYRAAKNGHDVDVFEAAEDAGGMAGHFDFDGVSLERFYHFMCLSDHPTFELLGELGLTDRIRWRATSMGFFSGGRLCEWGNPLALLRFPGLSLAGKVRYGIFALVCVRRDSWPSLEHESAQRWIRRWCGSEVYQRCWKVLFQYKFYEYADNVSAAWIWTRIRRIGRSRKSMFEERLGYIEGGSITLIDALVKEVRARGGRVHLGSPVERVEVKAGRVTGVRTAKGFVAAEHVISTTPTPLIAAMIPALPEAWKARYASIHNIGVICVIFKLARSVTPHFWVNISEPDIEIPGIIEFSNLRDVGGDSIVYVPYYMPVTHVKYSWATERLVDEAFACLQRLNPAVAREDIRATKVARLKYGQPICEPDFAAKLPPVQTPIAGLQIADTCFYYPEDRGIAESVRLGSAMAMSLGSAEVAMAPQE